MDRVEAAWCPRFDIVELNDLRFLRVACGLGSENALGSTLVMAEGKIVLDSPVGTRCWGQHDQGPDDCHDPEGSVDVYTGTVGVHCTLLSRCGGQIQSNLFAAGNCEGMRVRNSPSAGRNSSGP